MHITTHHRAQPQGGFVVLIAAAVPQKKSKVLVVVSVSVFPFLALDLGFFLGGFLTSLLEGFALNLGGSALKNMRGRLENIL